MWGLGGRAVVARFFVAIKRSWAQMFLLGLEPLDLELKFVDGLAEALQLVLEAELQALRILALHGGLGAAAN